MSCQRFNTSFFNYTLTSTQLVLFSTVSLSALGNSTNRLWSILLSSQINNPDETIQFIFEWPVYCSLELSLPLHYVSIEGPPYGTATLNSDVIVISDQNTSYKVIKDPRTECFVLQVEFINLPLNRNSSNTLFVQLFLQDSTVNTNA